jgi:hypothetical protein
MKLRWTLVAAAALALLPSGAFAQQRGFGRFGGGPLLASPPAQARLQLTADQKSKVQAIQMKSREELRGLFQGGGDRQAALEKFREANQKAEAEMVAVLTADQKKQYDGLKTDDMQWQGLGRSSRALIGVTTLNADQKTKLAALAKDAGAKRQDLFQSAQGDFGAIREKMQALDAESTAGIKKILNAEQAKQFDDALATLPQPGRQRNN